MYNPLAILATILSRGEDVSDNPWVVLVLSQEMIEGKEQPRRLGPYHDIGQTQSVINQAFPGASADWTHIWSVSEMETYLENAGYTHVEGLSHD